MSVSNHGETDTLFLLPPKAACPDRQDEEEQQQQQAQDERTSLVVSGRYLLGPRKVLRALSAPLSEKSPLLFTRRDEHLGQPRSHPLLLRERHVSIEKLNPHPESPSRRSTLAVALFNLVATVCGGGVLTLPLVFARAGVIPTTLLMAYGAVATDASLQRLVDAARTTGSRSYGDVAQAAFGKAAQVVTTATLATMLVGSLIAYLLLTRDVWAPVLFSLIPGLQRAFLWILRRPRGTFLVVDDAVMTPEDPVDRRAADVLLLVILLLAMPLMLKRELYALRYTCYIGFCSCTLLAVAVVVRAAQRLCQGGFWREMHRLNWWSNDPTDWLFAFPMVALCFFCSYNVLPVHSQLLDPSRERISWVLRSSMVICFVLFYVVGLGGYIHAHPYTPDNIITAFPMDDMYVLAGRMGYCLTLLFGLPLILLSCREAWMTLPDQVRDWRHDQELIAKYEAINENADHYVVNGVDFDEPYSFYQRRRSSQMKSSSSGDGDSDEGFRPLMKGRSLLPDKSVQTEESLPSVVEEDDEEAFPLLTKQPAAGGGGVAAAEESAVPDDEAEGGCRCPEDIVWHWIATLLLMTVTYATAISVPGVAAVWSIFGSSMALFIAFVVPTACFVQIRKKDGLTGKSLFAWSLLVISIAAMVVCTDNAIVCALRGTL